MTTPKAPPLESRIQRLQRDIARAQKQLRHAKRRRRAQEHGVRTRRLLTYGELVAHAGLDHEDHPVVLGLLLEGASSMSDPATRQRWYRTGVHHLTKSPQRLLRVPQLPVRDSVLTTHTREDTLQDMPETLIPLELP
jgi:hypothetical protein